MPTFTHKRFETYFEVRGSGEPLLLISGLSGSHLQWQPLSPLLEKHFQVIVFDNRGVGRSSAPDEPYSTTQMADDTLTLMDHLSVDRAIVVGWSMGGAIAQVLAAKQSRRVTHLCLLHSLLAPDASVRNAVKNWVNMRCSSMTYEQVARHVAWLIFSRAFAANEAAYEAAIQSMVNNPHIQPIHRLVHQAEALLAHVPPPGVAELPMPVSVLAGQEDRVHPLHHAAELHAAIPHSRLRTLPGAHVGAAEYPEQYVAEMLNLFRSADDA